MFNVLERLKSIKAEQPEKYERICDRLEELQGRRQGRSSTSQDASGVGQHHHHAHLAAIRKATDDFFSRLATIDRRNEQFWRAVGQRWVGKTEVDDLPHSDNHTRHHKAGAEDTPAEQLIETILLAPDPQETFKLCLEYNHPQRILTKLLLNRDRKLLLYGIRTKFGLPLPTYLTIKQHFQPVRASIAYDAPEEPHSPSPELYAVSSTPDPTDLPPPPTPDRSMLQTPDIKVISESLEELFEGSVLYKPDHLIPKPEEPPPKEEENSADPENPDSDFLGDVVIVPEEILTLSEPLALVVPQQSESASVAASDSKTSKEKVTFTGEEGEEKNGPETEKEGETVLLDDEGNPIKEPSETSDPGDEGGGGMDQYRLQRLKIIFEESDLDDEPGLDIDEFKGAMRKIMGENVPEREIELIFMKVDANCDGNVDWAEFLEYTLREFQERDFMTQLTKDAFFERSPHVILGSRNSREIRTLLFAPSQGFGKSSQDLSSGRYYTINSEGSVSGWTTDFKKVGCFDLISDVRGKNAYIRATHMCAMPEMKILVVSLTTGDVHFYHYDDTKMEHFFQISSMKSPVLSMCFYFQESESYLLMGDQAGKVNLLRFKNLQYDGLWGSLQLPHSNNPKVTWDFLVQLGKGSTVPGVFGSDWICQVKFYPSLNAMICCSADPVYSMCMVPFHKQREPMYYSDRDGFNCFDYNDFLNVIITGSKNHGILVWNLDSSTNSTMHFDGHEAAVDHIILYRDAEFSVVMSVDAQHVLKIWDFKDQACLQTFDSRSLTLPHYATTFMLYNPSLKHIVWGAREMLILKRHNQKRKDPVDAFEKTHDQPVIGALYNDLFECVVTACQESTIMVWNFQTGDKIIQFRNAHTQNENGRIVQVPIKSMTFDANKRRLLTCGSDGLIKLWNFNNGACLSFYDHLDGVDLNVVRYQKNRDLVIAAGWNRNVFMVRDTRGEDDVEEKVYEWEKTHRSDITALEIIYAPDTFEIEDTTPPNEINELDIEPDPKSSYIRTDIKRKSFAEWKMENLQDAVAEEDADSAIENNSAEVQKVITVSKTEAVKEEIRGDDTAAKVEAAASKNSVTSNSTKVKDDIQNGNEDVGDDEEEQEDEEEEEEEEEDEELIKISDDDSLIVTAASDGELIVWHLFSGKPIVFLNTDGCPLAMSRKARLSYASALVNDFPRLELKDSGSIEHFLSLQTTQHQKVIAKKTNVHTSDDPVMIPKVAQQARDCVTCVLVLSNRVLNDGRTASIVTSSTDGFVRAWSIHHTNGGLVGLFYAAHEFDSFVGTMCTDEFNELLFTGDTRGYIKVWLLCEWMQSWIHLKDHRHCFDPRSFPFIKRHKVFSPIIACRANHIMQKAVELLEPGQRGLYQQPYILNSFRGHLSRVTQIQVVFSRKVIITGSEDCSVRFWQFSGLYIGTLGQSNKFRYDFMASEFVCKNKESVDSAIGADDVLLDEDEDPDEIRFKPKVIVPHELAEKGSLATLQVLYSDQHKRTEIPTTVHDEPQNVAVTHDTFEDPDEFAAALRDLTIQNNRHEDTKQSPFEYFGYKPVYEVRDMETLIFTHTPLHELSPVGTLKETIPKNLFAFNIRKKQDDLINVLPLEVKEHYVALQKAGRLTPDTIEEIQKLVDAQDTPLATGKISIQGKIKGTKKYRLKDLMAQHKGRLTPQKVRPKIKPRRKPNRNVVEILSTLSEEDIYGPPRPKGAFAKLASKMTKKITKNKGVYSERQAADDESPNESQVVVVPSSRPDSQDSLLDVNEKYLDTERIELEALHKSEEEFAPDLMAEQTRNAKYEYLSLLEDPDASPSLVELYKPLIRADKNLALEIKPMLTPSVIPSTEKPTVVKSIDSMERIQRVFLMKNYNDLESVKRNTDKELTVPPQPRRIPSVVKGMLKDGRRDETILQNLKNSVIYEGLALGGKKVWGEQASLAIFENDFEAKEQESPEVDLRTTPIPLRMQVGVGKKPANVVKILKKKPTPKLLDKQHPFENRYIYRQLSDSVVHEHSVKEQKLEETQIGEPVIDLAGYLAVERKRKAELEQRNKRKRQTSDRLETVLWNKNTVDNNTKLSGAPSTKPSKSLLQLEQMMDEVKVVTDDFATSVKAS